MSGILALMLVLIPAARAQPAFDAASVKVSEPRADGRRSLIARKGGPGTSDPERISYTQAPLKQLIMDAYGLDFDAVTLELDPRISGPNWIFVRRYEVIATVPQGATRAEAQEMLRRLLAERFKLALHHQAKQVSGYELTIVPGGAKLKASAVQDPVNHGAPGAAAMPQTDAAGFPIVEPGIAALRFAPRGGRTFITGQGQSIADLLRFAALSMDVNFALLVDQTGLTGTYDFHLETEQRIPSVLPLQGPRPVPEGPSIFEAFQKQLGLKLEKKTISLDTLVVDHSEPTPIGN